MGKQTRVFKILYMLFEADGFIPMNKLSEQFNVSKRTIQDDLEKLESWISEYNLKEHVLIERKAGSGIKITSDEIGEKYLRENVFKKIEAVTDAQNYSRRFEILKMLIAFNDELTMQFLADQFYVSKTVILKDLEWVDKWLSRFALNLFKRQNKGIQIIGDEKNLRNAVKELLAIYNSGIDLKRNLNRYINAENLPTRMEINKYEQIRSMYPKVDIAKVEHVIHKAEEEFDFFLADEFYTAIVVHIAISIGRILDGNDLVEDNDFLESIYKHEEIKVARFIATEIEKDFNIRFSKTETAFICMHILGSNTYEKEKNESIDEAIKNLPENIKILSAKLIEFVGYLLDMNFKDDRILLFGLMFHLKTSIYRLKSGFSFNLPGENHAKRQYPDIYKAVWASDILYKKYCNVHLSEEEVAAITLHFSMAVNRQNRKVRAILVCNSGIGTAYDLSLQLKKNVPEIEIVEACSYYQLSLKDEREYDIILATIPIVHDTKPVLRISSVLTSMDILMIKNFLGISTNVKSSKYENNYDNFKEISFNRLEVNAKTLKEAAEKIKDFLKTKGYDLKQFEKPLSEIELKGRTLIMEGSAYFKLISNDVKKPEVYLFNTKTPILIENSKIIMITLYLISDENIAHNASIIKKCLFK